MHKRGVTNVCAGMIAVATLGGMIWTAEAMAGTPLTVATSYEVYAAGLHIADVHTDFEIGAKTYQMRMDYRTSGLASLLNHGDMDTVVDGVWQGDTPMPQRLRSHGSWKGDPRLAEIDFSDGVPLVRRLLPPDTEERQPIPLALTKGSIDTLSAMADLMRSAAETGRCDLSVRTFDGHRVLRFDSHTVGREMLGPYRDAVFSGATLRCDFEATPIAGMKIGEEADARPFHGSVWLATMVPGAPPLPVRMAFGTRWFGDAVMYLLKAEPAPGVVIAGTH